MADESKFEITVLIGPCTQDEADKALLKLANQAEAMGLGAVLSVGPWKDAKTCAICGQRVIPVE